MQHQHQHQIKASFIVGRRAIPRFMKAISLAALISGTRLEIVSVRRRLLSVKVTLRATGSASNIIAAGRIIDRAVGR